MHAMINRDQRSLERMTELARFIAAHGDETLPLNQLAARIHLSPSRLQRVFKAALGMSPKKFQQAARSEKFKALLRAGHDITEAIFECGYGSTSRVYDASMDHIGMTPRRYRAGGAGETIGWACRETVMGPLMMAATERGVCFAQFGESREQLLEQLKSEFPNACLQAAKNNSVQLDDWIEALNAHLKNQGPRPELPLDLRGTAFQIQVWEFLLSVQGGDVASYSEVAQAIGKPRAVRAVASACARNRIAVLVPCHRVLRADGSLGGYRWGVARKRALLDAERRAAREDSPC